MSERERQHDAYVDPLVVGLTRPAMYLGVTQSFLMLNVFGTTILFLALNNLLAFGLAAVLHMIGYFVCLKDPRFFDIYMTRLTTTPARLSPPVRRHWGGSTYDAH
jgi:type IV secretion system protein VirB3